MLFVRADVEDCPLTAKAFQIEVLPSIVIIEQQLKDEDHYFSETRILNIHKGGKLERVDESIKYWFHKKSDKIIDTSSIEIDIPTNNNNYLITTKNINV